MRGLDGADALALCGVDYLVVGPKVLATLKDSQTLQVRSQGHCLLRYNTAFAGLLSSFRCVFPALSCGRFHEA